MIKNDSNNAISLNINDIRIEYDSNDIIFLKNKQYED